MKKPTAPDDPLTLTLADAARICRCHVDTMRHRVLRGDIPHFRVGNKIRVRARDFEEFLMNEQQPRANRRPQA